MPVIKQQEIANLLDQTLGAHSIHEERDLNGVYDQDWPVWYATYLVEHGIGDLLGQAITTDQLARLLKQYDQEYRAQPRQESWPDYYAAHLLAWR